MRFNTITNAIKVKVNVDVNFELEARAHERQKADVRGQRLMSSVANVQCTLVHMNPNKRERRPDASSRARRRLSIEFSKRAILMRARLMRASCALLIEETVRSFFNRHASIYANGVPLSFISRRDSPFLYIEGGLRSHIRMN